MLKRALAICFVWISALCAQQVSIDLDPDKTEIRWSLAGTVHTTHGTFHLKRGHIAFDQGTGVISGDLVADAASGESGNASRDRRMNKEILESQKYPEFRFTPQKVDGSVSLGSHSTVRVSGTFLVHGSTHNVTIPMEIAWSGSSVTGTGKFSIPFVDWGIKDPSNFLLKVDKSVEVEIVAVGRLRAK